MLTIQTKLHLNLIISHQINNCRKLIYQSEMRGFKLGMQTNQI